MLSYRDEERFTSGDCLLSLEGSYHFSSLYTPHALRVSQPARSCVSRSSNVVWAAPGGVHR